ncbi:MAG: enoyl-CoA hydratase/isomerase family protein [Phycisphaerae bacterium]|jgi:enoyl-CoA hydratase|nr:enoyl-CoA hydratase/isomerase family protein [Phycisphaerae bacterium]MCZ2400437.1 enoyl-CoA hydratase/isomerase family protein [Phycisphaerae bacterium]NUQ50315.1 enoyl-CoA hydratase/isomerase family protein [Phycisphaerae bacterium]
MSVETTAGTRAELVREGNVATIRLVSERGPAILSSPVLGQLTAITDALAEDPAVRYVVFRGEGKVFVAGADIAEMANFDEDHAHALSVHGQRVFDAIESLPQVTFAAINGHALGGGCELALACSFRLMVAGAKIGQPEVRLGLIPGWGGTKRLPRIVPLNWALRMLYTGEAVSAEKAEQIGLVDEVVPDAAALDAALARWFALLAPAGRHTTQRIKRAVLNDDEANQFGLCFNCSEAREGMQAFLEKRPPSWAASSKA